MLLKNKTIWIPGCQGMVGSAFVRRLSTEPCTVLATTRTEVDLTQAAQINTFFQTHRPSIVFLAAAKVGGILANQTTPADFIRDNLLIQSHVIEHAHKFKVKKLVFLGSSCIYPKKCPQPINEEYLLSGPLEPTNEWYAIAKIAGLKMCQAYRHQFGCDFITLMPTNLYGPHDNFDPKTSHVAAALLHKLHQAKVDQSPVVDIWGSGQAYREFMHVDDLADACVFLATHYSGESPINVGTGEEYSIREFAQLVKKVTGYSGRLRFDTTKPEGTPRKLLDLGRLHTLGWKHHISLDKGLESYYQWYQGALEDALT